MRKTKRERERKNEKNCDKMVFCVRERHPVCLLNVLFELARFTLLLSFLNEKHCITSIYRIVQVWFNHLVNIFCAENTHLLNSKEKHRLYLAGWPPFHWFGFSSPAWVEINRRFTCLVKTKLVQRRSTIQQFFTLSKCCEGQFRFRFGIWRTEIR